MKTGNITSHSSISIFIHPDVTACLVFQTSLLLSTLVLCAVFRADMDHLHCLLFPSPLLSSVLQLVLLHHLLFTVTHRRT